MVEKRWMFRAMVLLFVVAAGCVNVNVEQDCALAANITACREGRAREAEEAAQREAERQKAAREAFDSTLRYQASTYFAPAVGSTVPAFLIVLAFSKGWPGARGLVWACIMASSVLAGWLVVTSTGSWRGWLAYSLVPVFMSFVLVAARRDLSVYAFRRG